MRKIIFIMLVTLAGSSLMAQTASKKTIDQTCGCVKKIKTSLSEEEKLQEAVHCMSASMTKNFEDLKKQYKVKSSDPQEAGREIGGKMGVELIQGCPEMTPYLLQLAGNQNKDSNQGPDINPDTLKLDSKVCQDFKLGKFTYGDAFANMKKFDNPDKTTYYEIKDGFVYDYSENKKYLTKWSIKWLSPCVWEQTFVESNEPNMKAAFKKGDKVKLEAIGSTKNGGLWISSNMMGMNLIWLAIKSK